MPYPILPLSPSFTLLTSKAGHTLQDPPGTPPGLVPNGTSKASPILHEKPFMAFMLNLMAFLVIIPGSWGSLKSFSPFLTTLKAPFSFLVKPLHC